MRFKKTKTIFNSVLVVFLIFFSAEAVLKFFNYPDPHTQGFPEKEILNKLNPRYSEYFCDNYHKKDPAQSAIYNCIKNEVNFGKKTHRTWILGGSTALENECGSKANWSKQLAQANSQIEFSNYSEIGMSSDMIVKRFESRLATEPAPDLIFLSLFISPEIQTYADERDANFSKLKTHFNSKRNNLETWLLWIFYVEKVVYNNVNTYRWFQNQLLLPKGEFREFTEILWQNNHDIKENEQTNWDKSNSIGVLEKPSRYILSQESLDYSLANFELNLQSIKSTADKKKIKVICVPQPHIKNYYQNYYPNYNLTYSKWVSSFNEKAKEACTRLGFQVVDGQHCIDADLKL